MLVARAALGIRLAAYRFDKYRTTEKPDKKPSITTIQFAVDDPAAAEAAFEHTSPASPTPWPVRPRFSLRAGQHPLSLSSSPGG